MNIRELTTAVKLLHHAIYGKKDRRAHTQWKPTSIKRTGSTFFIGVQSPYMSLDISNNDTLGKQLVDRGVPTTGLSQETLDCKFVREDYLYLYVKIPLSQVMAAAGTNEVRLITNAEILQSFKQCWHSEQPLVIATIASLKDVKTKFKTDPYNLIVAQDGTFYDMTPVDNRKLVQEGYTTSLDDDGKIVRKADFKSNIILTDATNSRLVVSNTEGYIVGIDLRGYRPFTINSANVLLSSAMISSYSAGPAYHDLLKWMRENDHHIEHWSGWFIQMQKPSVGMSKIHADLEAYWKEQLNKTQEDVHLSYHAYLTEFRPTFLSLLHYGKEIPKMLQQRNMKDKREFTMSLSNLDGVKGLMPHQADVLNETINSSINILQVGTGGGKSLLTIADISEKLKTGQIKKPLIMMPTNLVGQYVSEVYAFSNNELNAFVYSKETMSNYMKAYGGKRTAICDADKNLPPNTIYIVGYNILKSSKHWDGRKDIKYYLGKPQETFPIAEYLAEQGFDAVYLDEAHKLKNASGRLAQIVRSMLTGVTEITAMSGTIVYNNMSDMESILQLVAPETTRYNFETDGYTKPMKDMGITFIAKQPKEWAAFLPKFKDYLVTVDLPPAYREAYKYAEEEILKQIADDPEMSKYKDYLEGTQEELEDEDEDKLMSMLNMRFNKLETIINAPDTTQIGNIASPKVLMFDELISAHQSQGTYNGISFANSKGKKILAFGYNKNVSQHIMKWSKHKDKIVHYSAGNKNAITKFLTDPKAKVLLADITSIAEGYNLQMCDTCVPGHTKVLINEHTAVSIKDIYENDAITHVLGYDLDNKQIGLRKIQVKKRSKLLKSDDTVRIEYSDDRTGANSSVTFTGDHLIWVKDRGYIPARDVSSGDKLITFGGNYNNALMLDNEMFYTVEDKERARKSKQAILGHKLGYFEEGMLNSDYYCSDEHKSNMSKGLLRYFAENPTAGHEHMKRCWKSPIYRQKFSEAKQAYFDSPEYKVYLDAMRTDPERIAKKEKAAQERLERRQAKKSFYFEHKQEEYASMVDEILSTPLEDLTTKLIRRLKFASNKPYINLTRKQRKKLDVIATLYDELKHESRSNASAKVWSEHSEDERISRLQKMLKNKLTFPNKGERNVINLGIDNLIPTGDGSYWVRMKFRGKTISKNPDFIVNVSGKKYKQGMRTNKVVEVIGDRQYTGRDAQYDKDLIKAYKSIGIDCLIIDASDCRNKSGKIDYVAERLQSFVNNHYCTVRRVAKNVNFRDKYKYDLQVQGTNNFFVCGRKNAPMMLVHNCIALQTVFTPGMQSQAIARVFRPKIGDASRPLVNNITIAANDTVDMIKFARLLRKKCLVDALYNNADKEYKDYAATHNFEALPRVSLSMKSISAFENRHALERAGFFAAASAVNVWNERSLEKSRQYLIRDAAKRLNKDPAQIDLSKDVLVPIKHDKPVDGSKKVWTAKPNGFTINSRMLNLQQAIANLLTDYVGSEGGERQMIKDALQGKKVMTAFGQGTIFRPSISRSKPASVITIGNKNILLGNSEVLLIDGVDAAAVKAVSATYQAKPVQQVIPVKEDVEVTDDLVVDEIDVVENDDSGLDIFPGIVNNQGALIDIDGYGLKGFVELGPVVYSKIRTRQAIAKMQQAIEDSKLVFSDDIIEELDRALRRMKQPALTYAAETKKFPKIRIWQRRQKLPTKDASIEPFIAIINDEVLFVIPLRRSKAARRLIGKKLAPSTTPFVKYNHFAVKFVKGPKHAAKELKILEKLYTLNEAEETYAQAARIKPKGSI